MSTISEFAGRVKAHHAAIGASVDGIVSDVAGLKAKIEELQASAGTVTPEDQALLDELEAGIADLAKKTDELDDATAPAETPAPNP